jgi:3-(3-hydroxy-phenyl)propionate hydroxylase
VIVGGAGPVGLCLALALAQQDVRVVVIETLGADNFLEQIPRAGTNHPATLELYDRIGLYGKIEPRGIIAPLLHYWDRRERKRIAEFDHRHLKDDTRFPYVLQCERIKIVEEALKLASTHPNIDIRLCTTFTSFTQDAGGVTASVQDAAGETHRVRGAYLVGCEGARSIVRKDLGIAFEGFTYPDRTLNIEVAYDFRTHGYTERNYICFTGKAPPTAGASISRPNRTRPRRRSRALPRCRRGSSASFPPARRSISSAAISTSCTSGWRKNSGLAARSWPETPPT